MIGDFFIVWERDGSWVRCRPGVYDVFVDFMRDHLGEFGNILYDPDRDRMLWLVTLAGEPYAVRASHVASWKYSTRETRAESRRIDAALEAEESTDKARFAPASVPVTEGAV